MTYLYIFTFVQRYKSVKVAYVVEIFSVLKCYHYVLLAQGKQFVTAKSRKNEKVCFEFLSAELKKQSYIEYVKQNLTNFH